MSHKFESPSTAKSSQNQPRKPRTSVPPPQAARIAARFISGESVRKIARAEKRDRDTVRRVLERVDVQQYVAMLRGKFITLGLDAVNAIQHQLSTGKDGRLGMEILTHIGVVPSERERHDLLHRGGRRDPESD